MKNFFRQQTMVQPLGEKTQQFEGKYSPKVLQRGLGFGLAWLMKQLDYVVFEIADTNSMVPLFDYDHLLYCETLKADDKLNMYDVCVYEDLSGALIVHRITKVDYVENRFYFKGDNNLFADGWVPRDRIKYRVVVISYAR